MKKINVQQICVIKVKFKVKNIWFEYTDGLKLFGFEIFKSGFRNIGFGGRPIISESDIISKGFIIDGHTVYYKPHVELRMSDGTCNNKFFETESELNDFLKSEEIATLKLI